MAAAGAVPRRSGEVGGRGLRAFYFLLVLFNSGIAWSLPEPLALPYGAEIYLGLLAAWFFGLYLPVRLLRGRVSHDELFVFLLVLTLMVLPAILAFLVWGQPLYYGLIEERRALGYLVFFPLFHALCRGHISIDDLLRWVLISALACFCVSFYYYLFGFERSGFEVNEVVLRQDRIRIGVHYVLLAYFYALWQARASVRTLPWVVVALAMLIDLVVFMQSRQLMVATVLVSVFVLSRHPVRLFIAGMSAVALVVMLFFVMPDFYGYIAEKYQYLFSSVLERGLDELRMRTLGDAFGLVVDTHGMGGGSLSLLWRDGYHRFFGPNFYLADIGFVGSLVRFGFLAVVIHAVYWTFLLTRTYRMQASNLVRMTLRSYVALALLVSGMYTFMEYCGYSMGIVLAIIASLRFRNTAFNPGRP